MFARVFVALALFSGTAAAAASAQETLAGAAAKAPVTASATETSATSAPTAAAAPAPAATVKPGAAVSSTDAPRTPSKGVELPPGYVIGPEDALEIVFWREKDLSPESAVLVRPDGKISLPLINDIQAAGMTPDQLRERLADAASKFVTDPTVTISVKSINSRKVYITGAVAKSAYFPLTGPTTVMQLIATAGGVTEYADSKNIRITRTDNGKTTSFRFNYKDFVQGKNLAQNIELKPGDIVTVP